MKTLIILSPQKYNALLDRLSLGPAAGTCNHNYGFFDGKYCGSPALAVLVRDTRDKNTGWFQVITAARLCEMHLLDELEAAVKFDYLLRGVIPAEILRKMALREHERRLRGLPLMAGELS